MRSRYRVLELHRPHFVTATAVEWLPVFTTAGCCDIIVRALDHCREHKGLKIHAWVILDNHLHAVLSGPNLSATLRDLKSFTARQILDRLNEQRCEWLLNQLTYYRATHKQTRHQVWQEGSHPQAILDDRIMEQKIDYTHNNPVKRGLVVAPEHWRYSSAHEWLDGARPVFRCDPWR